MQPRSPPARPNSIPPSIRTRYRCLPPIFPSPLGIWLTPLPKKQTAGKPLTVCYSPLYQDQLPDLSPSPNSTRWQRTRHVFSANWPDTLVQRYVHTHWLKQPTSLRKNTYFQLSVPGNESMPCSRTCAEDSAVPWHLLYVLSVPVCALLPSYSSSGSAITIHEPTFCTAQNLKLPRCSLHNRYFYSNLPCCTQSCQLTLLRTPSDHKTRFHQAH